jgi:predicted RNase H-like HicB family nuclease
MAVVRAEPGREGEEIGASCYGEAMKYRVALRKTEEGYSVSCPGLPGCWSQGTTEEEALANIRSAIEEYLASRMGLRLRQILPKSSPTARGIKMSDVPGMGGFCDWRRTTTMTRDGLALLDEFSDAIAICVKDAQYGNLRVMSVIEDDAIPGTHI